MKLSFAISLLSVYGASAFAPLQTKSASTFLQAADVAGLAEPVPEPEPEPEPELPQMSQSMPFMQRPAALTGELAGDVGFDPLGFAKSEEDLMNYREAEIKHARLAMLVSR